MNEPNPYQSPKSDETALGTEAQPQGQEYEYRVKVSTVLPIGIVLGIAAMVFAAEAYGNDRALGINGIWLLPGAATMFYWAAATGFGLTVAGIIYRVIHVQKIVLTSKAIILPKSWWSSKKVEIPYAMIFGVREISGTSPRLLIAYRGPVATIHAARLPTTAAYNVIRRILEERTTAAQDC
jgi:hypothetical protein